MYWDGAQQLRRSNNAIGILCRIFVVVGRAVITAVRNYAESI